MPLDASTARRVTDETDCPRRRVSLWIGLWMIGSLVAVTTTYEMSSASLHGDVYLPVGHDAFYHGARMIDLAVTGELPRFDARMQAPEGGWVSWPWLYDYVMSRLASAITVVTGASYTTALAHLPPALALIAVALIAWITWLLRLDSALSLLAISAFALHAFTQYQFGVGALDHHGTEQTFTLAALACGMSWFSRPSGVGRAVLLGVVLGVATGVHTSLFILQLPLLTSVLLAWLRGVSIPAHPATAFSLAIVVASTVVAIPDLAGGRAIFDVRSPSMFQPYVALATACIVVCSARLSARRVRDALALLAVAAVLALPLFAQLAFVSHFATGQLSAIASIDEIRSPLALFRDAGGVGRANQVYTLLLWIAPVVLVGCIVSAVKERHPVRVLFWITSAYGLVLLLLQQRLAVFGVFALYLPIIVWLNDLCQRKAEWRQGIVVAAAVGLSVAYLPTLRHQLFGPKIPSMDQQFSTAQALLPVLADSCAKDPGVVLADPGDGHLIRYFTQCPVIANNFRLTSAETAKIDLAVRLIQGSVEDLPRAAPYVKYVFARLIMPAQTNDPRLFEELLRRESDLAGVTVVAEAALQRSGAAPERYFGVYKLED